MADVADSARLAGREHGLSVVATLRADQTIQATVVNCGVLDHPVRGVPVIGFTTRGNSRQTRQPEGPPAAGRDRPVGLGVGHCRGPRR
jgi:hypothetical protein